MARPWTSGFSFGFGDIGTPASAKTDSMQLIAFDGSQPAGSRNSLYYDYSNTGQFYLIGPTISVVLSAGDAQLFYRTHNQMPRLTYFGFVPG